MDELKRKIEIPKFTTVMAGAWQFIYQRIHDQLPKITEVLVCIDPFIFKEHKTKFDEYLRGFEGKEFIEIQSSTIEEVRRVEEKLKGKGDHFLVLGVGGGKTLDTAQLACHLKNVPFVSIPTTPSHDGIFSPVTVIRHAKETVSSRARMPLGVIVDLSVLQKVPRPLILSGIGDTLSNISSLKDWKEAAKLKKAKYDDYAALQSKVSYERIMRHSLADIRSLSFLEILIESLVLNGMAMEMAGCSLPCSGSEHMISHGLDMLYPGRNLHGLQVAFCTLVSEVLRDSDIHDLQVVYQNFGLPLHISDLDYKKEELWEAIKIAPQTRKDRYSILTQYQNPKDIFDKIYAAGLI